MRARDAIGKGGWDLREGKVGVVAAVVRAREAIGMEEDGICCGGAQRSSGSGSDGAQRSSGSGGE